MSNKFIMLGVKITALTIEELHQYIATFIKDAQHVLILNVNVYAMNLSSKLPWFQEFLNSAEIVFCDGAGVKLAARFLGHHVPQRITYADWLWELSAYCNRYGFTLYFLGGEDGVASQAAKRLKSRYPGLRIVGCQHGYFEKVGFQSEQVIDEINRAKPDILIVGFGMPLQERWLKDNWRNIEAKVFLTGGACFDYISGRLSRCPKWMGDAGFEWLYRLGCEPRRLFKRYVIGNPRFLARVLLNKIQIIGSVLRIR